MTWLRPWGTTLSLLVLPRSLFPICPTLDPWEESKRDPPGSTRQLKRLLYIRPTLEFFSIRWLRYIIGAKLACRAENWRLPTYKCYILLTGCVQQADSVVFSLLDTAVKSGRQEIRPSHFQAAEMRGGKGSRRKVGEADRRLGWEHCGEFYNVCLFGFLSRYCFSSFEF